MKRDIQQAKYLLDSGEVVGMPTETVYGLAARIDMPEGIKKIFSTKERPFFDPLIVHVSSIEQAKTVTAYWGSVAQILAQSFWPGPLTMILPKGDRVNEMITSGLDSVGIRMPSHPAALELLNAVGTPLAAPSANKFGKTSPTSAEHVKSEFNNQVFVLDGGACEVGIESTVLLVKEKQNGVMLSILRKGHVLQSDIQKVLSQYSVPFEFVDKVDKKESPGHMKHHYMPEIPLIVVNHQMHPTDLMQQINKRFREIPDVVEEVKIIKPNEQITDFTVLSLSEDPLIASREFYSQLRKLGSGKNQCIVFYKTSVHQGERWDSLMDRMNKAASLIF